MIKKLLLFLVLMFLYSSVNAATIESTSTGTTWESPNSWEGGIVPGLDDDVIVNSNISFYSNLNIGSLKINNGASIKKISSNESYYLKVKGLTINDGIVGGINDGYAQVVTFNFEGGIINNGTISYINTLYISNTLENNGVIDSYIKLGGNTEINNYFAFNKGLFLNGYELTLGEGNYIYGIIGPGIVNPKNNASNLYIGNYSNNVNINFENLYINGGFSDGILTANNVFINGNITYFSNVTINGNVTILNNYTVSKHESNGYYNFLINGNLVNKGNLGISGSSYPLQTTFNIKGNFKNTGNIIGVGTLNIYGNFDNIEGNITSNYTYLTWNNILGYSQYNFEIIGLNNLTLYGNYYGLDNETRENGLELYWKVRGKLDDTYSEWTETKCINVIGCIDDNGETIEIQQPIQIPTPTNLNQYIIPATLEEKEEIQVGSKIGKFQSGSGVIFELELDNPESKELKIKIELYEKLSLNTRVFNSDFLNVTGKRTFTIPLEEGDYTWKLRLEDTEGNTSDWIEFENNGTDTDFSIFEGFEPYPYGFSFTNKPTYSKNLDGGIDNTGLFQGKRKKIEGYKWDVFESAFDLSELDSERKLFNTFEMLGLNQEKPPLFNGSCFGLSTSALMYKSYPEYMSKNYTQFYNGVNNDIFGVNDFDTLIENDRTYWNDTDNLIFKDIQAIQTSQGSEIFQKEEKKSMNKESTDILNELKNMNNGYILGFQGLDINGVLSKHYVIPYKVEGSKIYIWDSNIGIDSSGAHYKQYLEILSNGKIHSIYYNDKLKWKTIDEIYIVPIEIMYNNGNKHKPIGLEYGDYYDIIFGGSSDIYLSDENGNISGIKEGNIYKDIPGVSFTRNGNYIPNSDSNDGLINFSVSNDLTGLNINVDGKIDEIYDLYVSANDYFTKIENIPTKVGDSDSFNITREDISMKLSDKNNSMYSIFSDDFKNNGTGTIYISNSVIEQGLTNYYINWEEVIKNSQSSITKSVDNDLDGEYEKVQEIKPITNNDGRKGEISGFVFKDKNDDGKLDENDKLLKGYKVALYVEDGDDFLYNKKGKKKNNPKHKYKCYSGLKNPEKHSEKDKNNEYEDVNCFVKTNKDGFFSFKNLEDGRYMIELLNNKDKNNKDGFGEVYEINILNGSISTNNNFIITKNEKIK